ncbi:hypothetical protein [Kribbella ginsengisoli]|uniref:hypothetical protein n=1 Tax=Kribbella ginsengisoli TaxID=363865 RepID=UPI0031E1B08E
MRSHSAKYVDVGYVLAAAATQGHRHLTPQRRPGGSRDAHPRAHGSGRDRECTAAAACELVRQWASVRFRVLTKKTARHLVDETRKSAKEQRRSAAKGTAEATADEIVETERVMREVKRDINRSGLTLVEDHLRLLAARTPARTSRRTSTRSR